MIIKVNGVFAGSVDNPLVKDYVIRYHQLYPDAEIRVNNRLVFFFTDSGYTYA